MQGDKRNAYKILVWKPEYKSPLDRPTRRWEDNTEMDVREKGKKYTGLIWLKIGFTGGLL
jgi:hypothetical protein